MAPVLRESRGRPDGGQFRSHVQSESDVTLTDTDDDNRGHDRLDEATVEAAHNRAAWSGMEPAEILEYWEERREANVEILGTPDRAWYVHFTRAEDAEAIVGSGELGCSRTIEDGVYAAAVGGANVPQVQSGGTLRDVATLDGRRSRESAVLFQADCTPEHLAPEEVVFDRAGPLPLRNARVVPAEFASKLLDDRLRIPDPFTGEFDGEEHDEVGYPLYHGSGTDLPVGGLMLPGEVTGRRVYGGTPIDSTFVTSDPDEAATWGAGAVDDMGADHDGGIWVYQVEPVGECEHVPDEDDPEQHTITAGRIVSKRRIR